MSWYVMVGGPRHGTCCAGDMLAHYEAEIITTHNPANVVRHHRIAVHRDLLLHRKLARSNIMYQANEDALQAYILDALLRVVGR